MSNKLSDIVNFNPSRILKKGTVAPFIEMASLPTNTKFIKQIDEKPFSGGSKFKNGDTLFARITPCLENGKTGKVTNLKDEIIGHGSTEFIVMSAKEPEFDEDYIYYFARLPEFREFAQQRMVGTSGRQRVAWQDLADFEFIFPPKEQRKKAAALLNIYDQKIDLNTQINQTLEQIAQALFKSWFVDFDPVRAKVQALSDGLSLEQAELAAMQAISGKTPEELTALSQAHPDRYAELAKTAKAFPCEMVEVDGIEMPKGWEYCSFGDVSECFDSKRIPLSKQQREKRKGNIPYYGATSVMDYVDEAIFDDIYLLVGEDGSVLKEDGTPFTQYIWGKSWVNNHAHILKGRNGISTEHLMIFIQQTNISAYITGAVQLKLNQKNMNSIPFLKANNKINVFFAEYIESLYEKIRKNLDENKILETARDLLLPRLLNGEIQL